MEMKVIMGERFLFRCNKNASSSQKRQGSVLTCDELKRFHLIRDGNDNSYQLTSYDLRLGSCHYVFNHPTESNSSRVRSESGWQLIHIGSDEELGRLNENSKGSLKYEVPKALRHTLTIPPYGSAIIELKEIVDTYTAAVKDSKLIVGRFDLKLSQVYQALISQQATQVEPLYCGKLYCFIHNLSGRYISMQEGDKIATIEFSYAGEQLSEEDRKALINSFLAEKGHPEKYISPFATADGLGIQEVRWFYERNRLPSDCGLNGLYSDVEKRVTEAAKHFEQTFENYFEKDDNLKMIAERVQSRIREQQRNLEMLVAVVTGAASLGVGSLLWMFYQELVKLITWQGFINTYLSEKCKALEIGLDKITLEHSPWLMLYIAFLVIVILTAFGIYVYVKLKRRKIDREVRNAVERELKALKEQVSAGIAEISRIERECVPLDKMQHSLVTNFSRLSVSCSEASGRLDGLEQQVKALKEEFSRLPSEISQPADSESPQAPDGDSLLEKAR